MNLRIPGPTPVPEEVLREMSRPMLNHRGPIFKEILYRVTARLQQVFQTRNDLYILTASGTGAMETAIVNFLSPGDTLLAVSVGVFGRRFAQIAQAYGARVVPLEFPPGHAADPERVEQALREHPEAVAVSVTHNETSTGVTNNLEAIAAVVRAHDRLLIVDAISSLGLIPLPVDRWGCDVVLTASQKGLMTPPGLSFISVSERAWQAYQRARMPRFYFDLGKYRDYYQRGQTPWTPAVSVFFALDRALSRMLETGLEAIYRRQAAMGRLVREGVRRLGLALVPVEEGFASDTVTAVWVPQGVDGRALVRVLREDLGVVVAGGQAELEGRIIRIGHMGYVEEGELEQALSALREALARLGYRSP